jgi:glutathione S-transferase
MEYVSIDEAIAAEGLRLILVRDRPSPWGQAAKAMMEYKGLAFTVGPQEPGRENAELVAWSGTNSGPVVGWNDEAPINRWNDILLLLERLAPERALLPADVGDRITAIGLAHEICGEMGFGWNYRLTMARPAPGQSPSAFALKYGYNDLDGEAAEVRVIAFMAALAERLKAQQEAGKNCLIGDSVTAVDFYWAAFCNLVAIPPAEICPLPARVRPMFERVPDAVRAGIDPTLLTHRDAIMQQYFKIPMEL